MFREKSSPMPTYTLSVTGVPWLRQAAPHWTPTLQFEREAPMYQILPR